MTAKAPTIASGPASGTSGLRRFITDHPFLSFVIIAYAFSWLLTLPFILWEWGYLNGSREQFALVFAIKAYAGPFLSAYIVTRITEGKEGWLRLRRSIRQWRESKWIYAFILVVLPLAFLLSVAILPGALESFTGFGIRDLIALPIALVIVTLGGGPLAEEPGWRGFALPLLLKRYAASRYAALKATLLLGVVWTFWHLPDFLTSAQHGGPGAGLRPFYTNLPIFFVMVMAMAVTFTWVYSRTHGSVFMAILLHAVINTLGTNIMPLFPAESVMGSDLVMLIPVCGIAVILLVVTKGRLGYEA